MNERLGGSEARLTRTRRSREGTRWQGDMWAREAWGRWVRHVQNSERSQTPSTPADGSEGRPYRETADAMSSHPYLGSEGGRGCPLGWTMNDTGNISDHGRELGALKLTPTHAILIERSCLT